ncbi:Glucans biosynthesis protein C [Chitinophaga sp. MM2321]
MTLPQHKRINGLDALRAIAMLLGIILHASIAYKMYPNPTWPSDNQFHTLFFDGTYMLLHSFRMQLFYIVAGFFARMLYLKIGETAFIKHRFKRIVLPFTGSLIFILPLSIAPFLYYKYFIADKLPPAEAWAAFRVQFFHWNGMAHLWFLYYLLLFYMAMLLVKRTRLIQYIPSFIKRFSINFGSLGQLLIFTVILGGIQVIFFREAIVEVSTGILPKISHFIYYGFFFVIGYLLHRNNGQLNEIARHTWLYLLTGLLLSVILFVFLIVYKEQASVYTSYVLWIIKLGLAMQTLFLAFGTMGFFLKYLNGENPALKYIADASYWLYLVHLSLVASLQVFFLYTNVPGWSRFWLVLLITGSIAMATYNWFIRHTFIGDILHGPRKRSNKNTLAKG